MQDYYYKNGAIISSVYCIRKKILTTFTIVGRGYGKATRMGSINLDNVNCDK